MALLWNPLSEMEVLRREIDRTLGNYGGEWFFPFFRAFSTRETVYPRINISDDENNVYIEALAPGLNPENLQLTVINNTLQINSEKQALTAEIKPEDFHRNERVSGKFTRVITLPVEVNAENVKAEYRDGLLEIVVPKAEAAKPKQITVTVG